MKQVEKQKLTKCKRGGGLFSNLLTKKGFTLIELLAVIVILAVIALIATPIIMNVINDSKKGAAKDAMYGYVKAVELAATKSITATVDAPSGEYTTVDGNLYVGKEKVFDINIKGNRPTDRYGTITLLNGRVTRAMLTFDGQTVGYDGNKAELTSYKIGDVVYFDPTGAVTDCKAGKEWTSSNTGTTCYKWNVIRDNGSNIEMLLDHCTTVPTHWLSKEDHIEAGGVLNQNGYYANYDLGPLTILKLIDSDSKEWTRVEPFTSSDNVTRPHERGSYLINYEGKRARIIGAQEVADIVGETEWTPSATLFDSYPHASWIYAGSEGPYWTDTRTSWGDKHVYGVNGIGWLTPDMRNINPDIGGFRPIVRVLKTNMD